MDDKPVIKLERDAPDRLVPKEFKDILYHRYFPVLSLTYVAAVIGIAAKKGSIVHYVFEDRSAYVTALFVALWISVPAVLWIVLHGSPQFRHVADIWYKITAAIMGATLLMSFLLFPEANAYGLRMCLVVTIPALFVLYYFFVRGGLPAYAAHPLSVLGLTFLLYGAVLNFLY